MSLIGGPCDRYRRRRRGPGRAAFREGLLLAAAPTHALRLAVSSAIRNEIGLDDRLVALVRGRFGVKVPNVIEFSVDATNEVGDAVGAASLLDPDAIIIDGTNDPKATNVAFNLAAGPHVVVLIVEGSDAIEVVTEAADTIGEVLVAGALRGSHHW